MSYTVRAHAAGGAGIHFGHWRDGFTGHEAKLKALLETNGCRAICEVGGGANPALPLDYIAERGLRYAVLDIAPDELAKAPPGYQKVVADICADEVPTTSPFDLVFSKMLAEHVRDPVRFHLNIFGLLRPGGIAFHFFPTLYALPFVVNRLLPERLSTLALTLFNPRDPVTRGKFPAHYHWCRGPSVTQYRRFERLGYNVEEYVGFFGHSYYHRVPLIRVLHDRLVETLLRHPAPLVTSYAYLVLRKPGGNGKELG